MSRVYDQYDYMSLDDFEELLADKPRDEKWELIGGRVVKMMVGARWEHHFIIRNLDYAISDSLRRSGSSCRTFTEAFRMADRNQDASVLPDVIVRCGPLDPGATSLDDPNVLIEVVSEGSVGRDRIEKWRVYQKLPSLKHYLLVERDKPLIEVFDRSGDAWFTQRMVEGLAATLDLPSIGVSIPLAEIYRDVLSA